MARKRLTATLAIGIAIPLAVVALTETPATASPTTPGAGLAAEVEMGADIPNTIDGEAVEVPSQYTPKVTTKAAPETTDAGTPEVGTVRQWVGADDGVGYYRKDYTLRGVGDYIEVWVANDLAFPDGDCRNDVEGSTTITDEQVAQLVEQFDTVIYPTETEAFSTPPDRDGTNALLGADSNGEGGVYTGDGQRTVALVDNIRDDNFYDFPEVSTYTAGFFSSALNEIFDRNTMTIDAYDWTHRTTADPVDESTDDLCTSRPARPYLYESTFGHEWQHLLHYYTDPLESTWLNEGLSDLAMALDGYSNSTATVYEYGADSHLSCFQGYGTVETTYNPNPRDCGGAQNSLNLWSEGDGGDDVLADYGNAYSFLLFLYDRYGLDFVSALHRDGDLQGFASLEAQLASVEGPDVYSVLHDYQTMLLVDQIVDTRRGSIIGVSKSDVTTASLTSSVNLENPQSYNIAGAAPNGADFVLLTDADGDAISGRELTSLDFSGVTELPSLPLAWSVVTDDPDREGDPVLFSGDENNLDAAMVTSVTVPASDPTLQFLAKYGAEEGYDYGYVSVSTDGGSSYTILSGDNTVDGPLGPALNGTTSGFEAHSFDLSAYAGQTVLLSIRYVSDGGVNEGGLLVDDLTLGGTTISDGSTLDPFDSPTEIQPTAVHNWNVRLIGIDEDRNRARQIEFDGRDSFSLQRRASQLRLLSSYPTVVAIVAYDEPTEQVQQYAPYTLTVNGVVQPGGSSSE